MERKFYFVVDAEGLIVSSDFLYDFEVDSDFLIEPWPKDVDMNVPKYNFSTGIWEEIGEPFPEVEYPGEGDDEPQESFEEIIARIKGEIADLKDRLELQETLVSELMGGKGEG